MVNLYKMCIIFFILFNNQNQKCIFLIYWSMVKSFIKNKPTNFWNEERFSEIASKLIEIRKFVAPNHYFI